MRADCSCATGSSPYSKVCALESVSEWSKWRKMSKTDKIQKSADHQLSDHFRKKLLFFLDTRNNQEHDAKNRLSIPGPSPEKPVAEIIPLKKNRPQRFDNLVILAH